METTDIRKLPKSERDQIRRAQIVEAAMNCVARHGFHKTTTAMIAAEAKLSEGQLYRYFDGKEALIGAIAETLTRRKLDRIIAARDSRELAEIVSRDMTEDSAERRKERVLLLEMHAEATRNPAVAAILDNSNRVLRAKALRCLLDEFPALDRTAAEGVAEYIATVNDGRILRFNQADAGTTATFLRIHKHVLTLILSDPSILRSAGNQD